MSDQLKPTAAPKATKNGIPFDTPAQEKQATEFAEEVVQNNVKHTGQNSRKHQASPKR